MYCMYVHMYVYMYVYVACVCMYVCMLCTACATKFRIPFHNMTVKGGFTIVFTVALRTVLTKQLTPFTKNSKKNG